MGDNQTDFDQDIQTFYAASDEASRLKTTVGGRVEFLRVQKMLRDIIQPHSVVYDVGGATGVHSAWLADDGHNVTLLDPVPCHVEQANQHDTFTAITGDARDLPWEDNSADVTLLFGPLYHLADSALRIQALAEARRVTKPGGMVVAAGVSRISVFNFMRDYGSVISQQREDAARGGEARHAELLGDKHLVLADGTGNTNTDNTNAGNVKVGSGVVELLEQGIVPRLGEGFPCAHCHTLAELRFEVASAGLDLVSSHGVEGPNSTATEKLSLSTHEHLVDGIIAFAEACDTPEMSDPFKELSPHLLVVAHVS